MEAGPAPREVGGGGVGGLCEHIAELIYYGLSF